MKDKSYMPVRLHEATAVAEDEDIAPEDLVTRVLWFYVVYNWKTREKKFFPNDPDPELLVAIKDKSRWNQVYRCQTDLPVPVSEDDRNELSSRVVYHENDWSTEGEQPVHSIARRIYLGLSHYVPANWMGAAGGYVSMWLSKTDASAPGPRSFELETIGKKFRITVEEVE